MNTAAAHLTLLLLQIAFVSTAFAGPGIFQLPVTPSAQQNARPECASQNDLRNLQMFQMVEKAIQCQQLPDSIELGQGLLSHVDENGIEKAFDYVCGQTNRDISAFNKLSCGEAKEALDCDQKKKTLCQDYGQAITALREGPILGPTIFDTLNANTCSFSNFVKRCEERNNYVKKAISLGCSPSVGSLWQCTKAFYIDGISSVSSSNYDYCHDR